MLGFNEAAEIHRRKRAPGRGGAVRVSRCFNEAAGIHRRKPRSAPAPRNTSTRASMRPPEFTGGNLCQIDT